MSYVLYRIEANGEAARLTAFSALGDAIECADFRARTDPAAYLVVDYDRYETVYHANQPIRSTATTRTL